MTNAHDILTLASDYYRKQGRSMPWRQSEPNGTFSAYKILVSEFMLQQTQVVRVIPKYEQFIQLFPDINALASATLPEVLVAWSGLGYNRRARYLYLAAEALQTQPEPWTQELLVTQKGIGHNTAAATLAYAYNQPVLYLETNIKTVLIYHFFKDREGITDSELLTTLGRIVPWKNGVATTPREFYWSLMDYGSYLKTSIGNKTKHSRSYSVQSPFQGSARQIRGKIIRLLLAGPRTLDEVQAEICDHRLPAIITVLEYEQMVRVQGKLLMLYNTSK